ncbi:EAL domain protein [Caprobacter fermentans]|uniref:EAL domain protein n=1 Tax=Caproicibacter fermentans TaxID=2576756 RepID=A0A6N8HVP7_9FIRM|nr:EAL domain-containing protein [Caproicibacter fermentans]MVB09871.1 EAL domain protein [Caproicibacter fermentans]OCN00344.1 hypothetical protein A7X67_09835 [Clostridium sp. W14A]QNK42169.1 EAL domain-containing protein [Caproicibacter fermentans]
MIRKNKALISVTVLGMLLLGLGVFIIVSLNQLMIPDQKNSFRNAFEQTDKVLFMSTILFLILLAAFLIAFFCFFKLKRFRYEAKIRSDEQKKYFTAFDALTGLPNRKGIIEQFDGWVKKCVRDSKSGGALFLDLDNLKTVNNTFGHDAGDQLIAESAARLKKFIGCEDIAGRTGSDEFAVLIHGANTEDELEFLVRKLIRIFREPYLINGIVIQLSCSMGALLVRCRETERSIQFEDILGRGEFVLNEAKQTHRGSYVLFNEDHGNQIDRQFRLERALKLSIESDELLCYFQPQYDCNSERIVGFETLARWKNAEFGMIPPSQFIPMAEKSGFIKELGRHVMECTFAFAKSMEGRGLTVSFNASPMELLEVNYIDYLISRYRFYGLSPNSIAIEITESSLMESLEKITSKLQILKKQGIQIYLDDFGTGFSSLTYLKTLPIDAIKIDKSFIDEIVTKDVEKDIVLMIVGLARRLNMEVIAEGVETEEQLNCVTRAGCHLIQGYFISRPICQSEVLPLLGQPKKQTGGVFASETD